MNMKKNLGIFATIFAAVMCAAPRSAQATGMIYGFEVSDPNGVYAFPNSGDALKVGDTLEICVRLVNTGWAATHNDPTYENHWYFKYTGTLTGSTTYDDLVKEFAKKPRLGLWVSGQLREAELASNFPDPGVSSWGADKLGGARHFTDLVFRYTVQPGDLALPIKLANASGTGPSDGTGYYLKCDKQAVPWALYDSQTSATTCDFAFNSDFANTFTGEDKTWWGIDSQNLDRGVWNIDLSDPGVYVQAIDFASGYADASAGIWRTVAQGSTTAEPAMPSLVFSGSVTNSMDLYVWTDDTNVAEVVTGGSVAETIPHAFTNGVRNVGKLRINAGDTSSTFYIRGVGAVGDDTQVFIAATPTNVFNAAGVLVTNFICRTIRVGDPLPPGISVTVNPTNEVTAANSTAAQLSLNVALTEAYTNGFAIPLKVSVKNDASLFASNYVGISSVSVNDNTAWDTVLNVAKGGTSASASLWLYANRGTAETERGLLVEVDTNALAQADSAAYEFFKSGKFLSATVVVNRSAPVVNTNALSAITAEANTDQQVTINVSDAYGELNDPSNCTYTVYWSNSGNDSPAYYTTITGLTATASGNITFNVRYPTKGDYTSLFYVVNQDGGTSAKHSVSVTVKAQKVVEATRLQTRFAETGNFGDPVSVVTLSFGEEGFSLPNGSSEDYGYVFFVPRDANSSNLAECVEMNYESTTNCDWRLGIAVAVGQTQTDPIDMYFLDGGAKGTTLAYDIVVRTKSNLDEGEVVAGWSSSGFQVIVTNVAPAVSSVKMGNEETFTNGGSLGSFTRGLTKKFSADTDEPSDFDYFSGKANNYTNQLEAFETQWQFKIGDSTLFTTNVFGPPSTPFDYKFNVQGSYTAVVKMRDKDMVDARGRKSWGPEFTFTFTVDDKPSITLTPHYGTTEFTELSDGNSSRIDVVLSQRPTEEITVSLGVAWNGGTASDTPPVTLNPSTITFGGDSANTTNAFFTLTDIDGTYLTESPGLVITAAVTTATTNAATGIPWSDVYRQAQIPVTISNLDPVITQPPTNAVERALNVPFTISYSFTDNAKDMAAGLTLTWTVTGENGSTMVVTNTAGKRYAGTFQTMFTSAGTKVVQLEVEDKDGGRDVASWHYLVKASKQLVVYPRQPSTGASTSLSKKWTSARGVGAGRVWAVGGAMTSFTDWRHVYSYAPSVANANAWACGYNAGDKADGKLTPGTSYAISANGTYPVTSGFYEYTDFSGRDSFFYAWLQTSGDDGRSLTTTVLKVDPSIGSGGMSEQIVPLPPEEEDATSYPDTILEAVFSKEFLPSDNLGDINQDGVPDEYAVSLSWNGGTLLAATGATIEDGGDVSTRLDTYNGDGDYLPSVSFTGGVPGTADGWSTLSVPFTADMEIRGFHRGLNHRTQGDGLNPNVRGRWISVPEFSEAETNAVAFWNLGATNTWAYFKANASTNETEYAEQYAAWTNDFQTALNKDDSWIPENRTDPTMWDTDGDSFPDGYEYYIWYQAAVGRMDGTNWVQMTGEKFNLNNIAKGDEISAADIMKAFNPTVKAEGKIAERDTDGDGLTDLEEFAIGTNPVHWDTDHDGMSDLWEVMRGMNPLAAPTDSQLNLDGDFMAAHSTDGTYAIVTMEDGSVYALPQNGAAMETFDSSVLDAGTNVAAAAVFGASASSNVFAISVFRYGDDSATCVPISLGSSGSKPLEAAETDLSGMVVKSIQFDQPLRLIHNQVYNQFGFDPRTGWNKDGAGYVAARWHSGIFSPAGLAVNTERYTCRDEYLVLKYRYQTGIRSASADIAKIAAKELTVAGVLSSGTTNPNAPFTEAAYTVSWTGTDGGGSDGVGSVASVPTYSSTNHGADTDEDGVPDGWELYVGKNPNDAGSGDVADGDGDGLNLVAEYAGTDSCNAYEFATNGAGTATIQANHPGVAKGWYNKFFPTDPYDSDTDGDGLSDSAEGANWHDTFRLWQSASLEGNIKTSRDGWTHEFTFIYGDPADDGSRCIRGGGLNPCTVDTDFDLLPDAWERQYAGVVFKDGRSWTKDDSKYGTAVTVPSDMLAVINRNDNVVSNSTPGVYITAGMDGTFGPYSGGGASCGDAVTCYGGVSQADPRTGTHRNFDFDNDGLQNFQEYLVQTLRHLRYDDTETPLMGSYLPDGIAGTRKYIGFLPMQTWDGAAFYRTARSKGFTGSSSRQDAGFRYAELGYFARPPKAWDAMALRTDGDKLSNYGESGFRLLLPPKGLSPVADVDVESRMSSSYYVSTDPRLWDSDSDGMDDYYELFHGLNPLLGGVDVISYAYLTILPNGERFSAKCNAWTDWIEGDLVYDAIKYPWAMGMPEADADGDGLRNTEEALLVNMPNPPNYHTDPTPLWMTDSSSKISFTSQYYVRDPYMRADGKTPDLTSYFWFDYVDGADPGSVTDFTFSFEENEGYDTDHDWIPDEQELTHAIAGATDPLNATDPDRRQAMYFPGEESVVVSHPGRLQRRIGENYAMLRSFTAEAWVRPEDVSRAQTILTRVCDYPASTLSNGVHQLRANFRIAIDESGRVYGQYDSSDAVATGSARGFGTTTVDGIKLEADKWAHVALSYDGTSLVLYVNGREVNRATSHLIPANGIAVTLQSVTVIPGFGADGYTNYPSALLLGADAAALSAMTIGPESSWDNYRDCYKGWIDEVRVWDGVRTAAQLAADYKKRYALADISAMREEVYTAWLDGGTHNANDGKPNLPAELLLHYGFQQLPSDVYPENVAVEPSGFAERVYDNVRLNGRPVDIRCGWWTAVPIASTVYNNRAIVPWLRNTCGMLPAMEGSTPDSRYWGELLAGMTFPSEIGVAKFAFPNTAVPYPYWNYSAETYLRQWATSLLRGSVGSDLSTVAVDIWNRVNFDAQTAFVRGSDLLPLGGAFAKRCPDFWDGYGPTDAWTATADDLDNNGLPDWWEEYAAEKYGADADALVATTLVQYVLPSGDVIELSAREAYQFDLARGLVLDENFVPDYIDDYATIDYATISVDENKDGLPDWWQKMYGVYGLDPDDDPDNDGLSNYYEWLISWGDEYGFGIKNGFPLLDPLLPRSGTKDNVGVTDYFKKVSGSTEYAGQYLGEILSDHDFMEDWWEKGYKLSYANTGVYDPWFDKDEDGWSNFAECRAALWGGLFTADSISRYIDGEQLMTCYPTPAIGVRITYNGSQNTVGKPLVVRTHSGFQKRVDAKFVVAGADDDSLIQTKEKLVGGYYSGATHIRGFLDPGSILPVEGRFKAAWMVVGKTYRWQVVLSVIYSSVRYGSYSELMADIRRYGRGNVILGSDELSWEDVGTTRALDSEGRKGVIDSPEGGTQIGTIDYTTGEYMLDLAAIAAARGTTLDGCIFKVEYQTRISRDWPQTIWLSTPSEGRVREGKNTVEAFIDIDGNGAYTPGEPFGVAQNVEIGWHRTAEMVIELSDTSSVVPRFDVMSLANDRTAVSGVSGGVVLGSGESEASDAASNASEDSSDGLTKNIRIVRRSINGTEAPKRIFMNKAMVLDDRSYISEADVLSPTRLDIDWQWLVQDAKTLMIDDIQTVEYGIEEVRTLSDGTTTNILLATFMNHYGSSRPKSSAVLPVQDEFVHSAAPTFRWSVGDGTMTAFKLQIGDADGNVVYDSGIQRLPGRTATFVDTAHYAFTPPVYVNDCIGTNGAPVFADGTNWQWRVMLFNAKYSQEDEAAWSDWSAFRTDTVNNGISTGYGDCGAAVRYYGPAEVADPGLVVVEAFESADFTGQPLARTRLSDAALLKDDGDVATTNAYMRGIAPGTVYLRAFIDRNNNGKWDRWESWGYANRRDENVRDIFSPAGLSVEDSRSGVLASATIYIEDTDLNRNKVMDCLEDESLFASAGAASSGDVDSDEDGIFDGEEIDYGTDPSKWDSDGDGIPDGWEVKFGETDPLLPDADYAADGDVMAYALTNLSVVTVWDGSDKLSATNRYAVLGGTARVGDGLSGLELARVYDYGGQTGLGLAASSEELEGRKVYAVSNTPVALVHAQVYDVFGFDQLTANPEAGEDAVNTKPFTALDKYLLIRYFESLGFCDERTVNTTGAWADFSLPVDAADHDRDGVPDGWELYVMFGTEGVSASLGAAKISPFNYDDARDVAPSGEMTVIGKWNGGAPAYDPWSKDSNGDGIDDGDEIAYRLDDLFGDEDNDQLPNFTEYLIGKGFKNLAKVNLTGISATNSYSIASLVTDYFRRVGNLYLGEMFTDHDFMEDIWEDLYDVTAVTRGLYDPWDDPDDDGWSNFAECRAGTDPTLGNSYGIKNIAIRNYPVPTIHATIAMGPGEGMLSGKVIVQAYSGTSRATGLPDAIWTLTAGAAEAADSAGSGSGGEQASIGTKIKYVGINPNAERSFTLSPGSITKGSVTIGFLDPDYEEYANGAVTYGRLADADWVDGYVWDRPTDGTSTGVIVAKSMFTDNVVDVGTIDYVTGRMTVDFAKIPDKLYIVDSSTADVTSTNATYTLMHLSSSHVRVAWDASAVGGNSRATLHLAESDEAAAGDVRTDLGHVREGRNTFVVFLDENDTGAWDPGEPYGVATDVDVGWSDAEFTVELTKTTPVMARFDIPHAISDTPSGFDATTAATDRGVVNAQRGYYANSSLTLDEYTGTNMPASAESLTRVRIVRNFINGATASVNGSRNYGGVVFDRTIDLSVHRTLTEADLLAEGLFDLDWGTLNLAYNGRTAPDSNLLSATYRVVIGDGVAGQYENFGNNLAVLFANRFEATRTPAVPDPKNAQLVYPARPTFRWSHANPIDKAYPAFRLRIYSADEKSDSYEVYDSGVLRAPARDSSGMYEWTAPIYAGMVSTNHLGKVSVFSTTNNYWWAVSPLDAKFTDFDSQAVLTPFRLGASGNLLDGKEYGSINVCVKYFGASGGYLSKGPSPVKNLVRVQAFATPDFSGTPVAEAWVGDTSSLANANALVTNAVLRGVASGSYYVRAFIDTDGDGVKSDWESWGYGCFVGDTSARRVWTPKAVAVSYASPAPAATVYIEDADTDNDGWPDSYEWNRHGNLATQGPIEGDTFFATVNPYLTQTLGAYTEVAANLDLSGMDAYAPLARLLATPSSVRMLSSSASSDEPLETMAVRIKSFSLEDGLDLEVVSAINGDTDGLITFKGEIEVSLLLACATAPDFSDAEEVEVKTMLIKAGEPSPETVTADELAAARAKVPAARFFKVVIRK